MVIKILYCIFVGYNLNYAIMNEQFIPYEEALILKQLGFNESCFGFYYPNGKLIQIHTTGFSYDKKECVKSPLYQQSFKWFRYKYNLHSTIILINGEHYMIMIDYINPHKAIIDFDEYKTYEEAELECLKKLIEIVKDK